MLIQGKLKEEHLEPELGPFSIYIEWFFELDSCRNTASISPIPFTAIHEFATIKSEIDDFEEFYYLMRRLDKVYIDWADKKQVKPTDGNTSTQNRNQGNSNRR